MTDISPEIYEKIKERYDELVAADKEMTYVAGRIQNGDIHYSVADIYAERSGQYLSQAMREVIQLDDLPDNKLYYNIAEKTIGRSLEDNYRLLSKAATVAQENMNREAGIGLKAAVPEMNRGRIHDIVDAAAVSDTQEKLDAALDEPVKTFSRTVIDDFKRENAKLHDEAGLDVRVEREYDGVGLHDGTDVCEWCLERAGAWTYEKAIDNGVFARHDGCGCQIDYTSKKGERSRSRDKWGFKKIEDPEGIEGMAIDRTNNAEVNRIKEKWLLSASTTTEPGNSKRIDLGKISPESAQELVDYLKNEIRTQAVENAIIVQKDGKVIRFIGDTESVQIYDVDLDGAHILHNHTPDKGVLSFGQDDFNLIRENQNAIFDLTDIEFDYHLEVIKDISDISYHEIYREAMEKHVIGEEIQDEAMQLLKERGHLIYEKRRIG